MKEYLICGIFRHNNLVAEIVSLVGIRARVIVRTILIVIVVIIPVSWSIDVTIVIFVKAIIAAVPWKMWKCFIYIIYFTCYVHRIEEKMLVLS